MAYFFYADESGNRGLGDPKDPLYVLAAVSLFEHRWHGFSKFIDRKKSNLMTAVNQRTGGRLDLADCEVKSNWLRNPKARAKSRFLSALQPQELEEVSRLLLGQLNHHKMWVFGVVVDKSKLPDYFDAEKLHRKAWELLCEQIERFMDEEHDRHQAILIFDDVSKQMNRSLAMKHAYLQESGTQRGKRLRHICEMPLFVRSELSNGVQLADLCAYNIYRAFRDSNLSYGPFEKIRPQIWHSVKAPYWMGLSVFPDTSPWTKLKDDLKMARVLGLGIQGS